MTRQLIIYWMWRVMSLVPGGVLLSSYLILNGRKREEARRVRKKVPSGRFMSDLNLVPASFFLTFAQPLLHLHPIPFLFNLKRREWGWRWAEKKWVGESLKKVSTTNRSWAWLPTITSSSLILLPSHSFWRKVRREEDDGHRLRELDEEVNGPPGRYLRLDLFIKVLSLLCPNLTDASSTSYPFFPFLFMFNKKEKRKEWWSLMIEASVGYVSLGTTNRSSYEKKEETELR